MLEASCSHRAEANAGLFAEGLRRTDPLRALKQSSVLALSSVTTSRSSARTFKLYAWSGAGAGSRFCFYMRRLLFAALHCGSSRDAQPGSQPRSQPSYRPGVRGTRPARVARGVRERSALAFGRRPGPRLRAAELLASSARKKRRSGCMSGSQSQTAQNTPAPPQHGRVRGSVSW